MRRKCCSKAGKQLTWMWLFCELDSWSPPRTVRPGSALCRGFEVTAGDTKCAQTSNEAGCALETSRAPGGLYPQEQVRGQARQVHCSPRWPESEACLCSVERPSAPLPGSCRRSESCKLWIHFCSHSGTKVPGAHAGSGLHAFMTGHEQDQVRTVLKIL